MIHGGIVGRIWQLQGETNTKISNVLNVGEITKNARYRGEILGRHVTSISCIIENCFYRSNSTNNGIGSGIVTGETNATQIDTSLITNLNAYVTNYNEVMSEKENFIELKYWKMEENGYLTFE